MTDTARQPSIILEIGARIMRMHALAMSERRDDMEPALIVYSPDGICRVRADPEIFRYLAPPARFEENLFYGCQQEIDCTAKAPWRVLSKRAAEERKAAVHEAKRQRLIARS